MEGPHYISPVFSPRFGVAPPAAAAHGRSGLSSAAVPPETRYAKAGDVSVAYQVFGEGDHDLVMVRGFATHLDLDWDSPHWVRFAEGLGSFTRVLHFPDRWQCFAVQ